jgi:inner membrane protein
MLAVSLFFLIWMAFGVVTLAEGMVAYAAILIMFLLVRFLAFLVSRPALRGTVQVIPQVNPLRWLAITDSGDTWMAQDYRIGRGMADPVNYPKFKNTSPGEVAPCLTLPEVRRLRYYSYIMTSEKKEGAIIISDPLRVSGRLFYPPHFKQVRIAAAGRDPA